MERVTSNRFMCAALVGFLAGCAAPPNTPGAGVGDRYTPIIDMQGVDQHRYYTDLDNCRRYAQTINPGAEMLAGALNGAVNGSISSSIWGLNSKYTNRVTNDGAFNGADAALNHATNKQQLVMINCMAGRGYHTLDGGNVSYVQQPVPAAAVPIQPAPSAYAPVPQTVPSTQAMAPQAEPAVVPAPVVTLPPRVGTVGKVEPPPQGQFAFVAERAARDVGCQTRVQATVTAVLPGVETYTVACIGGDVVSVRCEFSNCRVLQ